MDLILSMSLVLAALLAGAMSPGPSFVLIARTAMSISRYDAIAASIGMGIGGLIYAILALSGLQAVLGRVPELYVGLKLLGGVYLIYMAVRIWQGANQALVVDDANEQRQHTLRKSLLIGLVTQLSNPKTAIVYAGIFAALLPANIPQLIFFILPPLVFLVETGWYLVVTLVLSSAKPKAAYLKSKSLFDRIASGAMALLGIKLVTS